MLEISTPQQQYKSTALLLHYNTHQQLRAILTPAFFHDKDVGSGTRLKKCFKKWFVWTPANSKDFHTTK